MRVIAGSAKGRPLQMVPGSGTRPVTDRVKSAVFSIIGAPIVDSIFLDLYSGTGGIGIEALSRGAARVVFVEKNRKAVEVIHRNLSATRLADKAAVRTLDVFTFLRPAGGTTEERFDFVYVAPPQYQGLWIETLRLLDAHPWLTPGGQIIVQIFPKELADFRLETLDTFDRRQYGSTLLLFLARREDITS